MKRSLRPPLLIIGASLLFAACGGDPAPGDTCSAEEKLGCDSEYYALTCVDGAVTRSGTPIGQAACECADSSECAIGYIGITRSGRVRTSIA